MYCGIFYPKKLYDEFRKENARITKLHDDWRSKFPADAYVNEAAWTFVFPDGKVEPIETYMASHGHPREPSERVLLTPHDLRR